jgi:hypothetical protein
MQRSTEREHLSNKPSAKRQPGSQAEYNARDPHQWCKSSNDWLYIHRDTENLFQLKRRRTDLTNKPPCRSERGKYVRDYKQGFKWPGQKNGLALVLSRTSHIQNQITAGPKLTYYRFL